MLSSVVTKRRGAGEPAETIRAFPQDADALSEIWRLLVADRDSQRLREISWRRADGVVVTHEALIEWAELR